METILGLERMDIINHNVLIEEKRKKTKMILVEPMSDSWWVDFITTRHICWNNELFVKFEEKQTGEHKVCMGNNKYCNV